MQQDPFTDNAILAILTGTDFCQLQQAATAAAGQVVTATKSSSQAVQRLKESRAKTMPIVAVRVGRQARAGHQGKQ